MLSHKDPGTGCALRCFCPQRHLFCGVRIVRLGMAPQQLHSPPAPYCCYYDWGALRELNSGVSHFAPDHSCLGWKRHRQKKGWAIFNTIIKTTNKTRETTAMVNYCKQKFAERLTGLCACQLADWGVINKHKHKAVLETLLRRLNQMTYNLNLVTCWQRTNS